MMTTEAIGMVVPIMDRGTLTGIQCTARMVAPKTIRNQLGQAIQTTKVSAKRSGAGFNPVVRARVFPAKKNQIRFFQNPVARKAGVLLVSVRPRAVPDQEAVEEGSR